MLLPSYSTHLSHFITSTVSSIFGREVREVVHQCVLHFQCAEMEVHVFSGFECSIRLGTKSETELLITFSHYLQL